MGLKGIHHFCIQTSTYKETLHFYTEILDFELVKEDIYVPKRAYKAWLKSGDLLIEILTPKCSKPFKDYNKLNHGIAHFSLLVDDAHEELQRFKEKGFRIFKPKHGEIIYKIKGGYQFKLLAPEGTEIEVRDSEKI